MWVLDELPLETEALMLAYTAFQQPDTEHSCASDHTSTVTLIYMNVRTGSAETPHWTATEKYEAANTLNLLGCLMQLLD